MAEARVGKWLAGDSGPWPARARSGDAGATPGAVRPKGAVRPASAAVPATQRRRAASPAVPATQRPRTTSAGLALA